MSLSGVLQQLLLTLLMKEAELRNCLFHHIGDITVHKLPYHFVHLMGEKFYHMISFHYYNIIRVLHFYCFVFNFMYVKTHISYLLIFLSFSY